MTFLDIKAKMRRDVHNAFKVPAELTTADGTFALMARLHGRIVIGGDIDGEGYSQTIENVSKVIFNREELAQLGIVPVRGDRVVFLGYFGVGGNATLELDAREAYEGPIDERWLVTLYNRDTPSGGVAGGYGSMDGIGETL